MGEFAHPVPGRLAPAVVELPEGPARSQLTSLPSSPPTLPSSPGAATSSWPRWGTALWCRLLRGAIQRAVVFPILRSTFRLTTVGQHHLVGLRGSVLLAANHTHPVDHLLIVKAVPSWIRRRVAIAADTEQWPSYGRRVLYPMVGNGFPICRTGPIRASIERVEGALAEGWSVLLFPEGRLTVGGPQQPFKGGVGFCAVRTGVQVVPLRVRILSFGTPWFFPLLKRGRVEVVFGEPLAFNPGTSHRAATRAIEVAVASL